MGKIQEKNNEIMKRAEKCILPVICQKSVETNKFL